MGDLSELKSTWPSQDLNPESPALKMNATELGGSPRMFIEVPFHHFGMVLIIISCSSFVTNKQPCHGLIIEDAFHLKRKIKEWQTIFFRY